MRVSTKGRYAIRVLIDMAENGETEFHPLHNLAERQGLSEKYLEAILGTLVKNQVLEGARGKGGGYKLAKPAKELTVWDVLSVIETSMSPVECVDNDKNGCDRADICPTLPMWKDLAKIIKDYFTGITIAQLAHKVPKITSPISKEK
ncbi:Rrf2 family transcriptional regulator [Fibrobacter succinogenes]|uniref:RrF2 family transcriptional regulator n=1 Tax=Fibrobacter succinogenes TaxID=833 RepID=UPI0015680372|nr:Rrf2 family transcriptional regulator [Fibrobacter succinogenes]